MVLAIGCGLIGVTRQWRRADRERTTAQANEQLALRHAYAGDMNGVQRSLEEGDLGRARQILDKYRPQGKSQISNLKSRIQMDLRGWEWRYLWGQCRSDEQFKLTQQSDGFENLALSPDGSLLAVRQPGGNIDLWDWTRRRKTGTLTNESWPRALAFSPDGRLLASGYGLSDGTIRLWDAVTGAPAGSLEGHRGWVSKLVFAPDGRTLYSGSSDQTIRVWDVMQKQETETDRLRGHTSGLSGLALCRDGNTLVSCAFDGSIRVWDLKSKPQRGSHAVLPVRVGPYGAPFTRDSRHLITASPRDPVIIWEVATAKEIQRLPALGTNHHSVALSPDERLLAVGSLDGTIRIWDLTGQRLVKEFRPQSIPIFGLRFWDAGKTLVSHAMVWNRQIAVQRWDVASWVEIPFGRMDVSDGRVLAQSPDQRLLAVPSGAGVKLWDYATGELKAAFPSEAGAIMAAFSTDSRLLAAAISGGARVWEVNSGRELAALSLHANGVISVTFSRATVGSPSARQTRPRWPRCAAIKWRLQTPVS